LHRKRHCTWVPSCGGEKRKKYAREKLTTKVEDRGGNKKRGKELGEVFRILSRRETPYAKKIYGVDRRGGGLRGGIPRMAEGWGGPGRCTNKNLTVD